MTRMRKLGVLIALTGLGAVAYWTGAGNTALIKVNEKVATHMADRKAKTAAATVEKAPLAPAVSVTPVEVREFTETVLVTGTLVPRDEILVAPEVEGLKVLTLRVDEGDQVTKGQVLATLVSDSLDAQVAESDAQLARATAAIAQAKSQIAEAEARAKEATQSLERAQPLRKQGWIAESTVDQRQSAASSTRAQVVAARDGLRLAEAEKAQVEAKRRDLDWRRGNIEVKSPADGLVSRRNARIGGLALSAGEPMFRIIARGEIELDAEVPEQRLVKLAAGQKAHIESSAAGKVEGTVRLVSPEVDKATRLGRVRVFLGVDPNLRIGTFARGTIETARVKSIAVPQSAILYGDEGARVLVVIDGSVRERAIVTGLSAAGLVEVKSGLEAGDVVVAKSGTFLRDGDAVRPVEPDSKVSASRSGGGT
ncbi:MAG: efflux RND transporter periplasmic adaptor subunit [Hyphomicrobium sp.]